MLLKHSPTPGLLGDLTLWTGEQSQAQDAVLQRSRFFSELSEVEHQVRFIQSDGIPDAVGSMEAQIKPSKNHELKASCV